MKKRITVLLLLLALLLTGCTQTEIACGVDGEKNAFLTIRMELDWSDASPTLGQNLQSGFQKLADHYERKLGFAVEEEYTKTGGTLTMTLKRPAGSYEEAFSELEAMLTDETITPFLQVSMTRQTQDEVQGFGMEVTLDTGRILENLGTEVLPGDLREYFDQGLEQSTARLSLVLPASDLVSGPEGTLCENGTAQAQIPVNLTGQTSLKLSTRAVIRDGCVVTNAQELHTASIHSLERTVQIAGAILALALILLGILLLTGRRKKAPHP